MSSLQLITLLLMVAVGCFIFSRQRFALIAQADERTARPHSLPKYYGYFSALTFALPALGLLALWNVLSPSVVLNSTASLVPSAIEVQGEQVKQLYLNDVVNIANRPGEIQSDDPEKAAAAEHYRSLSSLSTLLRTVVVLMLGAGVALWFQRTLNAKTSARDRVEKITMWLLIGCASIAILTTVGIVFSVIFESTRFFGKVPAHEFLFGLSWSPQTALRADQVASEGSFGAIPLFVGTLLISVIALSVAVPLGLFSAIYLSEYASLRVRSICKPLLEVLAGIPTVVYGFFAALTIAPMIRNMGESIGLSVASESALAAGLVMGVMIIPFVSSLSDDVINAVPQSLRDGAYGLGSTKSETIRQVILPAALPGVVSAVLLAASRAIGETMIVVMAAGLAANLTINPLEAVTTVTVQIVTLLTGDQEFNSAKTLAAFALGLMLFVTTLALNVYAIYIARKYREQYD